MTTVRVRLQWTLAQLEAAAQHLELALQEAKYQGYIANWIAAIEKAIADNQATRLHVGNIRDLVTHPLYERRTDQCHPTSDKPNRARGTSSPGMRESRRTW